MVATLMTEKTDKTVYHKNNHKKEKKEKMAKQNNVVILSGKLFDDIEIKESANKKRYANVAVSVADEFDGKLKKTKVCF